jgi:hypothetical protein
MAVYSDLLFTVSGDPIDVRASIYENFSKIVYFLKKKTKEILVIATAIILLSCPSDLRVLKEEFILCKHLFSFLIFYFTYIAF